jgi:hypothetical protein
MATPIERIEKDFLLGAVNYKYIPLKCFVGQREYTLTLKEINKNHLVFESKERLSAFRGCNKIELKFPTQSVLVNIITFSVYVREVEDKRLITSIPDCLYKNLSRSYSRVQQMSGLNMVIRKDGFYYDLNYEKISGVDSTKFDDFVSRLNNQEIETAMNEHLSWIQQKTDGYKFVLFENIASPSALPIEGKAVGKTGKILFFSMPDGGLVPETKNSGDIFFTEQSLEDYLLDSGESPESAQKIITEMFRQKAKQRICCECYIPVVFLSYIIGYIHIWVNEGPNPPITLRSVEKFCQLAKIIVFSMDQQHYFEDCKKRAPVFVPKLLDISVGGFLFVLEHDKEKITYSIDDLFSVQITISTRVIRCKASIVRSHSEVRYTYYGCKFNDMAIEDVRFLFESVYGRPFTDNDVQFLTGAV